MERKQMKLTKVMFVVDESGSINDYKLRGKILESLNTYVENLKAAATNEDVYEIAAVKFSNRAVAWKNFTNVRWISGFSSDDYRPAGGTALMDGIDMALRICVSEGRDHDPETAFLIIVLTDGEENMSVKTNPHRLADRLAVAEASGKYTIVVNCPQSGVPFVEKIGVARGNIRPWEQTNRGAEELTRSTTAALSTYTQARTRGVTATSAFYVDTANVDVAQVQRALTDISSKVKTWTRASRDPEVIRNFFEQKMGRLDIGRVYFELIKSEKVQPQKEIVVHDTATGKYYSGWHAARQLLGLPPVNGEIRLRPGKMGNLKVFIQSTSVNRKLKEGQRVLHVDG